MVPAEALRQLALAVARGALDSYSAACRPGGLRLSEKGVLQLVFDVRFLCDVLAVGAPELAPAPAAGGGLPAPSSLGSALPYKALARPLLDTLTDRLDPIDWATYEPFLIVRAPGDLSWLLAAGWSRSLCLPVLLVVAANCVEVS